MEPEVATPPNVLQLRVTLRAHLPIWRSLLVSPDATLADLHRVLQCVFDWDNDHEHLFTQNDVDYGPLGPDAFEDDRDERATPIGDLLKKPGDALIYLYDFGDEWCHDIQVEAARPLAPGEAVPSCLAGEGASPPMDIGGAFGYEAALEILHNPNHEEYEEMVEAFGPDFDTATFDPKQANDAIARMKRRK